MEIDESLETLRIRILDLIEEYEKEYNARIHISDFKYDHLTDKKDFKFICFQKIKKGE